MKPTVSAIIVHFNHVEYTRNVVRQLRDFTQPGLQEIIVVDNASQQPLKEDDVPGARIIHIDENRGYGYACNRGAEEATGSHLFILNNDLAFRENPLPALLSALAAESRSGAAGPALMFPDGRHQPSWSTFPTLYTEFREAKRQEASRSREEPSASDPGHATAMQARQVDWITGACMLISREAWKAVRGFDEAYFFYFEDVDLCMRLRRAGFKTLVEPRTTVVHFGGGSDPLANASIVLSYRESQLRFYARYNSAPLYFLLKLYLRRKFLRLLRRDEISPALGAQVLETIRTFSRNDERQRFLNANG